MKVVHVLKKIETIDNDIKDLRKLERSLQRNKSFSTPIYLSIEKEINKLLGMRVKLFELRIENPPEELVKDIEGEETEVKTEKRKSVKKTKEKKTESRVEMDEEDLDEDDDDDEGSMLTQSMIDEKIKNIETEKAPEKIKKIINEDDEEASGDDESVKLLDIALEKGTLSDKDAGKGKKKIRFFKDNFPGGEY